ncbi:MAG: site-specific DNA-methyltransferase, partial [Synergistaceae bacterium]|nr:site-specific DNA-methyltransferase [Synergistaceae bacterium]
TNFRPVFTSPDDFTPEILDSLTDNIKPDRSNLDLLFMSITDAGLPLSLKYSHEEVDGFTIHTYGEGEIVACFGENLSEEVVRNIAKRKAKRVIFRDSGFAGACERINLEQIFRHYSPDSDLYIL